MFRWIWNRIKDLGAYLKFFFVNEPSTESELLGVQLKFSDYCPKDKAFLLSLNGWANENEETKILSISLWSEGHRCEHNYNKVRTSKEHSASKKAVGIHKDYVCSKCGHSFCCVVGDDAVELSKTWGLIAAQNKR